jgi:hypothetical protein
MKEFVSHKAIARVRETGPTAQWHGIRSNVYLFDGALLECQQTAAEVVALIDKEEEKEAAK